MPSFHSSQLQPSSPHLSSKKDTLQNINPSVPQRYHRNDGVKRGQSLGTLDAAQRFRIRARHNEGSLCVQVNAKQSRRTSKKGMDKCIPVNIQGLRIDVIG